MESIFQRHQSTLQRVLDAFRQTEYGVDQRQQYVQDSPLDYERWCKIPLIGSSLLTTQPATLALDRANCIEFTTSGSSGKFKTIFVPLPLWVIPLSKELDALAKNPKTVFLRSQRSAGVFLRSHEETFRARYPRARFEQFSDVKSTAQALTDCAFLYFFDYPAGFARLLHFIEAALGQGLVDPGKVANILVHAKLTGEPMDPASVKSLTERSVKIFRTAPEFELFYGAAEVGPIAKHDYSAQDTGVPYRILDDLCLVEVLDPDSHKPIENGVGLVVVTSFRTTGTIILRYNLGDTVSIRTDKGKRYLERIARPNSLPIAGRKLSAQFLSDALKKEFGSSLQLKLVRTIDASTGAQVVQITTFFPSGQKVNDKEVRDSVVGLIVSSLHLDQEIASGTVAIDVTTKTQDQWEEGTPEKSWQIQDNAGLN